MWLCWMETGIVLAVRRGCRCPAPVVLRGNDSGTAHARSGAFSGDTPAAGYLAGQCPSVIRHPMHHVNLPPAPPELERRYKRLSLREVFLSFAGYRRPGDPVAPRYLPRSRRAIRLQVRVGSKRWELLDRQRDGRRTACRGFQGD